MKIVTLLGSPRTKGNSATIAAHFNQTAADLGAETKTFVLNEMTFRGCQACMACKEKVDRCVLKDDLEPVLDEIRETDILVLATPVYFMDISSQMKMFIDRTYSYFVPDFITNPVPGRLEPGKKLIFIQTQNQSSEEMFKDIYPRYSLFFQLLGFKDCHCIRACNVNQLGDVMNREDILKQAKDIAMQVIKNEG